MMSWTFNKFEATRRPSGTPPFGSHFNVINKLSPVLHKRSDYYSKSSPAGGSRVVGFTKNSSYC